MSFGTLALIGICGLSGPLLAAAGRGAVPVVAGEILAGVVIGRTGINLLSTDNATLAFLSDVGFTMLMFSAGMNVPVREPAVRAALPVGAARADAGAMTRDSLDDFIDTAARALALPVEPDWKSVSGVTGTRSSRLA